MKELKSILQPPIDNSRFTKRWVIAQNRGIRPLQAMQNSNTENAYHRIIATIKANYLKPGDTYFERDFKYDKSESIFDMHCFACDCIMIRLDCMLYYEYEVQFAFYNCPFEAEIRILLSHYPLDAQAKEVALQPDFKAHYEHLLSYHRAEFIHIF